MIQSLFLSFLSPTRRNHTKFDLGPSQFQIEQVTISRSDHQVGGVPFSFYQSLPFRPTVVYIHSYNSNRLEANSILKHLLKSFNVVAIELQRVKNNQQNNIMEIAKEQGYISFGFYQSQQIYHVVNWLKKQINQKIYIWGRSMGAVSALIYQNKYKDVDGLILDSPFHSLQEILLAQLKNITNLPNLIGRIILFFAKLQLRSYLKYDIQQMNISQKIQINCPVYIIVNLKDPLAGVSGPIIYDRCKNIRKLYFSEAEHSSSRESTIMDQIIQQLNHLNKRRIYTRGRLKDQKQLPKQSSDQKIKNVSKRKKIYIAIASSKNRSNQFSKKN